MSTAHDATTNVSSPAQTASPSRPAGNALVSGWARGRRQVTPWWGYKALTVLAVVRFTVGICMLGIGTVLAAVDHSGWAVVPLAGAAVLLTIASLDAGVVRSASHRG
jgi:hypothetical protein